MPTGPSPLPRVDLARVVDLADRLESDASVDPEVRRRRDRSLGRELAGRVDDATARVEAWLDGVRAGPDPTAGERAARAERTLRVVLVLAGGALGAGAAWAFFHYDGSRPVNVVQILAFFVGLQALLLFGTAVLALPESWRARVPGLAAVQDVLRLASPGRWQPLLRRLLPPAQRQAVERAAGLAKRHQRLYGDVQKWSFLALSQWFAVAFQLAAWATAAALITFSDLAFGWSTTLDVSVPDLHRGVSALSGPWARIWPDAVPGLTLVRDTQYFRGQGGLVIDALGSAGWWRFLLAAMLVYGVTPRVVALGLSAWQRRRALARAFQHFPGVAELHDRLDSRWVETAAESPERHPSSRTPGVRRPPRSRPERLRAVRWSGLTASESDVLRLLGTLGGDVAEVLDGGAGSGRSDRELCDRLASDEAAPALLVKSWEPPLGEFLDWLAELRERLGDGRVVFVLPLAESAEGPVLAVGPAADTWTRRLDQAGDPWLDVVTGESA